MKRTVKSRVMVVFLLLIAGAAEAKTIRATEIASSQWSALSGVSDDLIVEFRQGDKLPITFSAEGDLLETIQMATNYVGVKKSFWIRVQQNKVQMSLDGMTYKDISDVLNGSFQAGAGSDQNGGVATAIHLAVRAYLK